MKATWTVLLGALLLLCGCTAATYSEPSASPASSASWDRTYCESAGGYWNPNAGVCETPLFRR